MDKCFTLSKGQSTSTKETSGRTKCPALQKKLLRTKYKKLLLRSFQKQNQRKQMGQYLQREFNWTKRLNFN